MNQDYKIVLFGNGIYHEIELSGQQEIKIGTTSACTLRFDQANFFENFELQFVCIDDVWRMMCSDNLYIASDSIVKQYSVNLTHGDEVSVKYQTGNAEVFNVSFLIDFDKAGNDYNRQIDITKVSEIMIGGTDDCDVIIHNEYIGNDYITLAVSQNQYTLINRKTRYGIYVNGFKIKSDTVTIGNFDFFMIGGCQFYVKFGHLYTAVSKVQVSGRLNFVDLIEQNNEMQYPKFQRNTRVHVVIPEDEINILPPKDRPKEPEKNLLATLTPTILSAAMMMVMRSMMSSNKMFVVYSGAMMGMGVVTSIFTYVSQGKKYKKEIVKRESEYTEYAQKQERLIQEKREIEKQALTEIYISPQKEVEEVLNFDSRLFEKDKEDADYLELYVGHGNRKAAIEVKYREQDFKDTQDPMVDYPEMLHDEYEYLEDVPITVNLKEINALGVVGSRDQQYELLKNFTIDISTRHFYDDVKVYYIFSENEVGRFEWIRWFKNVRNENNSLRNFMYDEDSKKVMLESLYADLSMREGLAEEAIKDVPSKIVFVYSMEGIEKHPVAQYIKDCNKLGYTFIFFNEHQELIPQGCDHFIYLEGEHKATLLDTADKANKMNFTYDIVEDHMASYIAKKLGCTYVDSVNLESKLTSNITLFKLMEIMSVEDLDLTQRWENSKVYESMAAPLGVRSDDSVVVLDLNEKHHGPHGLVAGTTGSGKSEILQSYILSMATLFHPYEVGFVIIDFKGGGMVNQFKNLPHLIGSITNIDGREIDRSLLSIKAELKKRQAVFAQYNVNHIDAYIKLYKQGKAGQPLPHLILIVDEFAELKSDQPEFMKELISAARIGRSLGVHLILATQKPSGVVDDQIWSNSKFKLCLKVQNKNDSNEVLKSPLAAEIKEPGRAYLQVGNNEIFELFQSAYSGADINADKMGNKKNFKLFGLSLSGKRSLLFEQKKEKTNESESQLEAIVNYVDDYCKERKIEHLPGICLPSLENVINYRHTTKEADVATDINLCIGMYDDPSNQLQDVYYDNITQNNTFILGSSQYGKTNMLQVMIKGLAMQYSPKEVNIYILDFASMILKTFDNLKHVGGVVTASDDEKLKNFFKMMGEEVAKRKNLLSELGLSSYSAYRDSGYKDLPQIVIMIDNMTALRELYLMNEDNLLPICREGLAVGISVIMTNQQMSGMGYKYLSNFSSKLAFYCNDSGDYSSLFNGGRMSVRNVPGRAICEIDKQYYELQTYLAFEGEKEIERVQAVRAFIDEINTGYPEDQAKRIPEIPDLLTEEFALKQFGETSNYRIMLGLNYRTVEPFYLPLQQINSVAICAREGMGRKNLLRNIVGTLQRNMEQEPAEVYVFDDMMRNLEFLNEYKVVTKYAVQTEDAVEQIKLIHELMKERYQNMMTAEGRTYIKEQSYILLIINNKDAIDAICKDREALEAYKAITSKFKNLKTGFVFSNVENTQISFSANDIMKQIKDQKRFIIFEDVVNIKVTDLPMSATKEFKKPIRLGDGYMINENSVGKIKFIKVK